MKVLIASVSGYLKINNKMSLDVQHYLDELGRFLIFRKKDFFNTNDETRETFDFNFKEIDLLDFKINSSQIGGFRKKVIIRFYNDAYQKHHIKQIMGVYATTPSGLGRVIQKSNLRRMWRKFDQADQ